MADINEVAKTIFNQCADYDDADTTDNNLLSMIKATLKYVERFPDCLNLYDEEHLSAEVQDAEERGIDAGMEKVMDDPGSYDLYDTETYNQAVEESYSDGENAVLDNPSDYELFSEDDIKDRIEDAIEEWKSENETW